MAKMLIHSIVVVIFGILIQNASTQQTGLLGYFSQIFRRPTTTGFFDTTTDVTSYVTVFPIAETNYLTVTRSFNHCLFKINNFSFLLNNF